MTTLVVGASGATGSQLVGQLLEMGHRVKAIVRSPDHLPTYWKNNDRVTIIQAAVLDIHKDEMAAYLRDCDAVASCLGHNMHWKGIFGEPKNLVTDSIRLLCEAIEQNSLDQPTKLVLMNTTGNSNKDLNEVISFAQKCIIGLLRLVLPPHVDNEAAAEYLRSSIGQHNDCIEWVALRPDSLINLDQVSDYELHPSPIRSAIFNAGKTSRINVGHCMAKLIADNDLWNKWKGQMPVIYNKEIK